MSRRKTLRKATLKTVGEETSLFPQPPAPLTDPSIYDSSQEPLFTPSPVLRVTMNPGTTPLASPDEAGQWVWSVNPIPKFPPLYFLTWKHRFRKFIPKNSLLVGDRIVFDSELHPVRIERTLAPEPTPGGRWYNLVDQHPIPADFKADLAGLFGGTVSVVFPDPCAWYRRPGWWEPAPRRLCAKCGMNRMVLYESGICALCDDRTFAPRRWWGY